MKFSKKLNGIGGLLVGAFVVLGLSPVAQAFDTGPHSDLTREVMVEAGMNENAVGTVQLENWLTDYYSNTPTAAKTVKKNLEMLHFDNLTQTSTLSNYWDRFTINAKISIQQAAREGDSFKVLVLLGMSLHAVQDFYTHSNWVETHPVVNNGADYNTITWFDTDQRNGVRTGRYPNAKPIDKNIDHGDYDKGLNHDSQTRPNFDKAYVFAYAGSQQWVNQVRLWVEEVNPNVWSEAKNLNLNNSERGQLTNGLFYAYRISQWAYTPFDGKDGLWKGKGSGFLRAFVTAAGVWTATTADKFVNPFKTANGNTLFSALTNPPGGQDLGVNASPTVPVPKISPIAMNKKVVLVQTTEVKELPVKFLERKIDPRGIGDIFGRADFYAKITIDGMTFLENTYQNQSSVSNPWKTIKFVDENKGNIDIRYEVWDEDWPDADEHVDVYNGPGRDQVMTYNTQTREIGGTGTTIRGIFDNENKTWNGDGDEKIRASVRGFITTRTLKPFGGR